MTDKENKNSVSTVDNAMNYVETPANNLASWKIKDLGLQFLLFGVAEIQAKRVIKLLQKVDILEDIVLAEDNLRELEPLKALSAYKMSTDALKEATEYIFKTRKEMDWNNVESRLNEMNFNEEVDGSDDIQLSKLANKLLETMKNPKSNDTDNEE